jgi:alkylhydroperoxidase family enzyme
MAWIKTISDEEATGLLAQLYDAARKRAGRIYNVVRVMSPNPPVLRDSIATYRSIMFGPSPLSRALREMLAVVVSARNRCVY